MAVYFSRWANEKSRSWKKSPTSWIRQTLQRTHDNAATYPGNLLVRGRVGCRRLLHAGHFTADRGGVSRRRGCRMFRDGRGRRRQRIRLVARADFLDNVLRGAVLPRARHLVLTDLSHYLAG